MSSVQDLIDRAQARHWSFNDVKIPAGAVVNFLNERQRAILIKAIAVIEPLIGETRQILTQILPTSPTSLVAIDGNGNPYFTTTVQDGYGILVDGNGNPYIDTANPMVIDPFGQFGSVPGLPLPADLFRIIACTVMLAPPDFAERTVEIMDQKVATRQGVGHIGDQAPKAFVSANRLIPVRLSDSDIWSLVTSMRLSMVRVPVLAAVTDLIVLPESCVPALTADLVVFFAQGARGISENDKRRFERDADQASEMLNETAINILGAVTTSQVVYRK